MSRIDDLDFDLHNLTYPCESGLSAALSAWENLHNITGFDTSALLNAGSVLAESMQEITKPFYLDRFSQIEEALAVRMNLLDGLDFTGHLDGLGNLGSVLDNNYFESSKGIAQALDSLSMVFTDDQRFNSAISSGISSLAAALQNTGASSFVSELYNAVPSFATAIERILPDVDFDMLGRITENVLSRPEEWDIDNASEAIAWEYEQERDLSYKNEKLEHVHPVGIKKIDAKEVRVWLSLLIKFLAIVLPFIIPSSTVINNYNTTQIVNNYYVEGWGYQPEELNSEKYRIINQDVTVRIKHDCHSAVIAHLEEGEIVQIVGKYKKWRQIIWKDEDDEVCMGWVQNYKLSEFKKKNRRRYTMEKERDGGIRYT